MRTQTAVLEVAAVFLGSVMIVCGCDGGGDDGGGGTAGYITVSVDSGTVNTIVGDIQLASYYTSASGPFPADSMVVMAGAFGSYPMAMISFSGTTAIDYDVALGDATVLYTDAGGTMYATLPGFDTGTLTATAVGVVGELVEGTFDVVAHEFDPGTGDPTGTTVNLTGTFSVERAVDDVM